MYRVMGTRKILIMKLAIRRNVQASDNQNSLQMAINPQLLGDSNSLHTTVILCVLFKTFRSFVFSFHSSGETLSRNVRSLSTMLPQSESSRQFTYISSYSGPLWKLSLRSPPSKSRNSAYSDASKSSNSSLMSV